ncbi:Na(+) H(+) antiporter subunit B [Indibacter alkaliphilus LW1]|jgi:multicomponent Na+:H+ antiporter subunit B|uniref:Na(+) H(+) antiporter subunit B n=1 Tax=Indibacter alkaliphilus (strain CCUG 57479 / KCTC 22604 / LW1) TaxID=1189612 RepID=S2E853_INDAL|nr:Na+/H+ antiporter subunit B [Indibacter alkaliphilus]EOZ98468.1 Na(+) H(+) antiporter subunit B [Indibacter alkaliphilus LW1]
MKSIIFQTASKYLLPLLLLFSVFILLRGHYLPGGGFVGGLMAAIAFILYSFAFGLKETKSIVKLNPRYLMPVGLAVSILAAVSPWLVNLPVMTGLWYDEPLKLIGMVGSSLFFDIGVYLVVIGSTLTIMFSISETI